MVDASHTFIVLPLMPITKPTSVLGISNSYIGKTSPASSMGDREDAKPPVARPESCDET